QLDKETFKKLFYVNSGSVTSFKQKFNRDKKILFDTVKKRFQEETKLNGTEIAKEWFPQNKWDVFISHSHNDEDLAIELSSWLNRKFKLDVFIDSFVWGSADELLRIIDKEYCVIRESKDLMTYDYNKRNFSTSHVHMMLSGALCDVIYNTECIIFLNTPNSLSINDLESKKTNSSWIYNEMKISSIVARRYPREDIVKKRVLEHSDESHQSNERKLQIEYDVTSYVNKFKDLTYSDLLEWEKAYNSETHPLDNLYFKIKDR
ncbi:MAG: hypothetical protein VB122_08085, partial [Erysipelotrichales bacterium]|nr:hypothetical protein [Erysipelotrichales bacterium]